MKVITAKYEEMRKEKRKIRRKGGIVMYMRRR